MAVYYLLKPFETAQNCRPTWTRLKPSPSFAPGFRASAHLGPEENKHTKTKHTKNMFDYGGNECARPTQHSLGL